MLKKIVIGASIRTHLQDYLAKLRCKIGQRHVLLHQSAMRNYLGLALQLKKNRSVDFCCTREEMDS